MAAVQTIRLAREGNDVILDWNDDPLPGTRFAVYTLGGPGFDEPVRIGTTEGRSFVHEGAAASSASYAYRVSRIDACGNESSAH